jgi:DNA-binding FrmR family transcriptional regulator
METIREEEYKNKLVSRLNRAEGQIRGIRNMVEKDAYCDDILNQISAVQAALDSVGKMILESHIRGCVVRDIQAGREEIIDELMGTIGRMMK